MPTGALLAAHTKVEVYDKGKFEVTVSIEEGKKVEDVFERLDYTQGEIRYLLLLRDEYEAFREGRKSALVKVTAHTRDHALTEFDGCSEGEE